MIWYTFVQDGTQVSVDQLRSLLQVDFLSPQVHNEKTPVHQSCEFYNKSRRLRAENAVLSSQMAGTVVHSALHHLTLTS